MEIFRSFSVTHKGVKHGDSIPCQDASAHLDFDTGAIAIVADGHGSSRCFRSDRGSQIAVEITKNRIFAFVKETPELPRDMTTHIIGRNGIEVSESKILLGNLVKRIIDGWFMAVMEDEEEHPLIDDTSLQGLAERYRTRFINDRDYRCHAYGTTLIAAAVVEGYWFAFQVGDGKCVVVYEDGSWDLPLPRDDNCKHNITSSICDDDSLSNFRYWFGFKNQGGAYTEYGYGIHGQSKDYIREINHPPVAIFIGSDGVEDSYPWVDNDKYVINFYRNRFITLQESGFEPFKEELDGFVKRFAHRESTDDVSIALIIGPPINNPQIIGKMKQESQNHEKAELILFKRRDAHEKKILLDMMGKKHDDLTYSQERLEEKILSLERETTALNSRKTALETELGIVKLDALTYHRTLTDLKTGNKDLEEDRKNHLHDEKILLARITLADDEERRAKKAFERAERLLAKKKDALSKKQRTYDKYFCKLPTRNGQMPPTGSPNEIICIKMEGCTKEIEKIRSELSDLETKGSETAEKAKVKKEELFHLRRRLSQVQLLIRQTEVEIHRGIQNIHRTETRIGSISGILRKLQGDMAKIDHELGDKQAVINTLYKELEEFKDKNKGVADTLSRTKDAWEMAKAEIEVLEAINQNNNGKEAKW